MSVVTAGILSDIIWDHNTGPFENTFRLMGLGAMGFAGPGTSLLVGALAGVGLGPQALGKMIDDKFGLRTIEDAKQLNPDEVGSAISDELRPIVGVNKASSVRHLGFRIFADDFEHADTQPDAPALKSLKHTGPVPAAPKIKRPVNVPENRLKFDEKKFEHKKYFDADRGNANDRKVEKQIEQKDRALNNSSENNAENRALKEKALNISQQRATEKINSDRDVKLRTLEHKSKHDSETLDAKRQHDKDSLQFNRESREAELAHKNNAALVQAEMERKKMEQHLYLENKKLDQNAKMEKARLSNAEKVARLGRNHGTGILSRLFSMRGAVTATAIAGIVGVGLHMMKDKVSPVAKAHSAAGPASVESEGRAKQNPATAEDLYDGVVDQILKME